MADPALRLIVIARLAAPRVAAAWTDLDQFLCNSSGVELVAVGGAQEVQLDGLDADLVVVLGGDGAILRACHALGLRQLPILGINLGRLGFLADLSPAEFKTGFDEIRERRYRVVEHLMFECRLNHADGTSETLLGLNEVAVSAAASLRMLDIELTIDDERVTTYSCDGLIVATPVGSTAHSLSAGGPILRQDLQAFVITPICPHTLSNRPVVDRANCVYRMSLPHVPEGAMVAVDGQIRRSLVAGDTIEVRRAPVTFKMAKLPRYSYYTTLHDKLGWGGQPRYRGS